MKICDMSSIGSSGCAKGMKRDRQPEQQQAIKRRQKLRKNGEEINDFMATMAAICPEYYAKGEV